MDINWRIGLSVGSAIIISCVCYRLWGLEGAVFGFINTLLIIGLFKIWDMVFIVEEKEGTFCSTKKFKSKL